MVNYMIKNNLKKCRQELELTQKELGKFFDVSDVTVRGWENAYDTMPLEKLVSFCNMFNYSIDYILMLSRTNKIYNEEIKLNKKEIGNKLKRLKKEKNYTQQKMADLCSIARSTYSHYEMGMNLITTFSLYTICKKFDISMDEFLRSM